MTTWGRSTYGDPCRECGHVWSDDIDVAVQVVRRGPATMRAALDGSDGTGRAAGLDWDARSYVCHVADNLRAWAERLVAAVDVPELLVGSYDADLLAVARNYSAVPVSAALWSLERSVDAWLTAVGAARIANVRLVHPDRGTLTAADVASTNAHDLAHHVFDVRRCR